MGLCKLPNRSGVSITIDGEKVKENLNLKTENINILCNNLIYDNYYIIKHAVVHNNAIHIVGFGNTDSSSVYLKTHYKWDGSTWQNVSELPYKIQWGRVVVYNNEIHILGGNSADHYKWNGSKWVSVSTLPYNFSKGGAVIYNNEIHILGGENNSSKHYKWNGSSWTSVSNPPNFYGGNCLAYNNEIHIFGDYLYSNNHYKWNGTSWISDISCPYGNSYGTGFILKEDNIYMFGNDGNSQYNNTLRKCYVYNGTVWT